MAIRREETRRRHRNIPIVAAGILLVAAGLEGACAGSRGSVSSRLAVELEVAAATGRPDAAEAAGKALSDPAADLEVRCAAWYALGRTRTREGALEEALESLEKVGRECAAWPRVSSEALWEVAGISERIRPGTRHRFLEQIVRLFPDEPAAARAVRELASFPQDAAEVPGRVALLQALYRRTEGREVAPVILWETAELLRKQPDEGSRIEALGLYRLLANRHPTSGLRDDALWAAGNLALDLGDPRGALDCFVELRGLREWSFLFGSYERPLYQEALKGLARAFRKTGRPREASRALEILARERPGEARELLEEAASIREEVGDLEEAARIRRKASESRRKDRPGR